MSTITLFNFSEDSNTMDWKIIDDVVMGGRSTGSFFISENGHGVFEGNVSLENNGGFSSIRYTNSFTIPKNQRKIAIRLKGDGKSYQFRIKHNRNSWESYVYNFNTTGNWQVIEIPLKEMYPSFRGRRLNKGNFDFNSISEMGFLISNKQNENFRLEIDKLELIQ
jgi:hypothetical protein